MLPRDEANMTNFSSLVMPPTRVAALGTCVIVVMSERSHQPFV
jgi:hypothetical protein